MIFLLISQSPEDLEAMFVAKDDGLVFLTHLASEHIHYTFSSADMKVTKLELLETFVDRIHKLFPHSPHAEANLHPGMKIRPKSPKIQ